MISDPFVRNVLLYAGSMLLGALAAGLSVLMVQLAGVDPINLRPVLAAALGPIVTGLLARQLTRAGREDVGNLVTRVGVPQATAALEVEATRQAAGASRPAVDVLAAIKTMSPGDLQAVRDAALARHEALAPADPLPPNPRYPRYPAPASPPESPADHIIGLIDKAEEAGLDDERAAERAAEQATDGRG